ncbi:MAG: tetraacyldisaccharide 4'-kinase [Myxococcales bacterium]|jgi:tetraacyldisaccharide 4'-kinase
MSLIARALWFRQDESLLARLLLSPLWLLSLVFGRVVVRRRAAWRRKALKVGARVVSVGNLTVGGAGKTPVTIEVVRRLTARGERVAVLSRGYGRKGEGKAVVVSDGERILLDARAAGDEPVLIARSCPGALVLVGADRASLAQLAVAWLGARTLVLDDGFQHLRLARDLDIVVIDGSNPFGNGHLMPRGPLREPKQALAHAGLIWLSKVDQASPDSIERLAAEVRRLTGADPVRSAYRVADVRRLEYDGGSVSLGPDALRGRRVYLLAAIARPESFARTVEGLGAEIAGATLLPDHAFFGDRRLEAAAAAARKAGAEAVVVTEKDAVRLAAPKTAGLPFLAVRVELDILAGEDRLAEAL